MPSTYSWSDGGLSLAVRDRINHELCSWDETPYMLGQCVKGAGVDCIRFVCAVLNNLYREERAQIPRLPADTAMHNREGAVASVRLVRRLYPNHEIVTNTVLHPGDVVLTAQPGCGPGHSILVGARRNQLWHALGSSRYGGSVQRAGIGILDDAEFAVYRIFRMTDKETWA